MQRKLSDGCLIHYQEHYGTDLIICLPGFEQTEGSRLRYSALRINAPRPLYLVVYRKNLTNPFTKILFLAHDP